MSEQKFPPRVWIWFYEENHVSKRKGIREAHKCTPHGGKLQPEPTHISIQEHQHILAEKDKRIERLREALRYYAGYMSGDAIEFTESGWQKYPDPKIAAAALQEETK